MKILPVVDLMHGQVVHGIAGERESYQPIRSTLSNSAEIISIAEAFQEHLGLREFYVADLDAILEQRPHLDSYAELISQGYRLWLDSGVRSVDDARSLLELGIHRLIVGLETCPSLEFLRELVTESDAERIVFSLDLKNGEPFGACEGWQNPTPWGIANEVATLGVSQMIVLDLVSVGSGRGVSTQPLCETFRKEMPHLQLITGGGVRTVDDLKQLDDLGVAGVLVASALHNGSITRTDLQPWMAQES